MRKLLLIIAFFTPMALWGQAPDCQFAWTFSSAVRSSAFPALSTSTGSPCVSWRVTYQAFNMTGVSMTFDGSPDNGSSAATGVWTSLGAACPASNPCAILAGSNPMTDTAESNLQVTGYYPWMSLNMGTFTGTGTVLVKVFGYRGTSPAAGAASTVTLGTGTNTVGKVDILGNAGATLDQAPGSAVPANALQIGYTDGTNLRVPFADPCLFSTFNYYVINVAVNTQIVAGSASKNVYVCQFFLAPVTAAANVNIVESATSGNACATSPTGMMGGATAATGATLTTNGGFVLPFAGGRAWMKTAVSGDAMCIFTSATVTGVLSWVQF